MKKIILLFAVATALVFTASCSKDDSPAKSTLQSLSGTVWYGSVTQGSETANYTFTFGTDLEITVEVGGYPQEISASYTYDNPVVRYQDKSGSGNSGEGIVSADGKTLTINGNIILTYQTPASPMPVE